VNTGQREGHGGESYAPRRQTERLPGEYDRPFGSSVVVAVAAAGRPAPGEGAVVAAVAVVNVNVLVQTQRRGQESRVWMTRSCWSVD